MSENNNPIPANDELAVAMNIGTIFAQSGFFPDTRTAAQAIVKILAGRELGVGPFASMRGVIVNRGKLELSAGLVGSLIKSSGRYDYRVKVHTQNVCTLVFFENGQEIGESTFTIDDAKRAELTTGKNAHSWRHYPRNMLFARALTNGARWFCPDVFGGPVYTPEELGDTATVEVIDAAEETVLVSGEPEEEASTDRPEAGSEPEQGEAEQVKDETTTGGRPYPPQMVKDAIYERIRVASEAARGSAINPDKVGGLVAKLEECFAGDGDARLKRHSVTKWLVGKESVSDFTIAEASAFWDWLVPHANREDGSWDLHPAAPAEAAAILRQALKDTGQQELEL